MNISPKVNAIRRNYSMQLGPKDYFSNGDLSLVIMGNSILFNLEKSPGIHKENYNKQLEYCL